MEKDIGFPGILWVLSCSDLNNKGKKTAESRRTWLYTGKQNSVATYGSHGINGKKYVAIVYSNPKCVPTF